jgi:hypothetical protein
MHVQSANNKVYVHTNGAWHLFSYDMLVAVHPDGSPYTYTLDERISNTTTMHIRRFAEFCTSTIKRVSEEELKEMSAP